MVRRLSARAGGAFHLVIVQTKKVLGADARLAQLDKIRNILAHRLSSRRSITASSTLELDGTQTNWREEKWHIPGASESPMFDQEMLQHHLDNVAAMLRPLVAAAREFAENSHGA